MKRTLGLLAAFGLSLALTACGGGSDSDNTTGNSAQKPNASISVQAPSAASFSLKDGPVTVSISGAQSSSETSDTLTYKWELIERPELSDAALTSTTDVNTEFTAELPGDYVISLIVNDGTTSSEADRMTFTATTEVPVAITKTVYSIALGTDSLGLDGSNSTPPTGETGALNYTWTLVEKPLDSAAYLENADAEKASLHLDVEGVYQLTLVVNYEGVESEPANIQVTVSSGNAPPVAEAQDITVTLGQAVTLDASSSTDAEGSALQYRWKWDTSPDVPDGVTAPEIKGHTTANASFTPIAAGEYTLKLFVFDGERKSEEKEVKVTVEKDPEATTNQAPVGELIATGYYPSYSIGEQEVGLRAEFNFAGYDPEGEPLQIIDAQLLEKPDGSAATLVEIGSWKPLGRKIQTLDVAGTYKVQMTVSDGVQQLTTQATMEAKVGNVNGQPSTRGVDAQSKSVLVGDALVFDASSSDPNDDPITFHWELVDKPDGSQASIEAVIEPESQEYRRAKVITDVPGSYTARLIVSDDRGLYAKTYAEDEGFAKITNTAPEIRSVVWARNWGRLSPGEDYYQILPCMSLLHRPVVVDADGDEVHTHEELVSTPDGGEFTSYPDAEDCPNSRGQVFSKPGTYTFRYYATDLIEDAPEYDFVVKVDALEDAKGVRLRSLNSDNESLWHPLPYENIPPYASDFSPSIDPILERTYIQWSMTAVDGDYTIENVKVSHINGELNSLQPAFEGVEEGTVIAQGTDLNFKTWLPAVPCVRTDDRAEGFHFSFNIKEIPEITFVYETWLAASDGLFSDWEECTPGQLD